MCCYPSSDLPHRPHRLVLSGESREQRGSMASVCGRWPPGRSSGAGREPRHGSVRMACQYMWPGNPPRSVSWVPTVVGMTLILEMALMAGLSCYPPGRLLTIGCETCVSGAIIEMTCPTQAWRCARTARNSVAYDRLPRSRPWRRVPEQRPQLPWRCCSPRSKRWFHDRELRRQRLATRGGRHHSTACRMRRRAKTSLASASIAANPIVLVTPSVCTRI
jgi:hypothetical protein